jgi:hypothetical protein
MVERSELTEAAWSIIASLLPSCTMYLCLLVWKRSLKQRDDLTGARERMGKRNG